MEPPAKYTRDPKGRFVKGVGGGRPKGVPNKSNGEIKEVLREILSQELPNVPAYLRKVDDPGRKVELILKLLPYMLPRITNEKPDPLGGLTEFTIEIA